MTSMAAYDAVIIGGGHNGLVCAFYLARAGMKVRICERRSVVGGAAVTEEFHPGFRNSLASYTVSLLNPHVIADMKLKEYGLRFLQRPISNFLPTEDGRYLKVGGGLERTQQEFQKFSDHDAERLPGYYTRLEAVADVLRDLSLKTPPNPRAGIKGAMTAASQVWPALRGGAILHQDLLDLFTKSARGFLDAWFESDPVKAAFGFDGVVGNYASPDTPGSAYVLLHHVFGEVDGVKGAWGHAIGGMGAITQAMQTACLEAGVEISLDAPVRTVNAECNGASGIVLESGEEIGAKRVVANVNPKLLYTKLIDSGALDQEFYKRMKGWRCESGTFRMNVALSELPDFSCLPGKTVSEHHQCGILIAPTLDYMDRAFIDAKRDGWSQKPIVEMLIPSTMDDSLAPEGEHVASLFCQQFSPELPEGRSWDDEKESVADHIIDTITEYAPNFKDAILGRMVLSPKDLEEKFGLIGGDIFHGAMSLDQLWAARPALGYGDYRGALRGLYHCGAGAHPGGGVTGLPGRNAAREILRDARLPFPGS
ncbi:NAD(P)/FAD-dependent oxidoreductase [Hyphococcus flavus]|uniref:Pyridine nucleotide-disulfide oxidoreductase domain-containing protein 2 n=1 Tax=Hyphococcus flavus TaxID=1866326 RepID=A0AAF0CG32_9PROT|nr:NAD(P)/FAD-dependent oxidoreductase [Hyphococcus flavus]WDI31738.1 NAD(P)/FAD-dependent oxidoreductase [Hyphococcus flavus]